MAEVARAPAAPVPASPAAHRRARRGGFHRRPASAQMDAIKSALQGSKLLSSFLDQATRYQIEAGEFQLFFTSESRTLVDMLHARGDGTFAHNRKPSHRPAAARLC